MSFLNKWVEVARAWESHGLSVLVLERCSRTGRERGIRHHDELAVVKDPVWTRETLIKLGALKPPPKDTP